MAVSARKTSFAICLHAKPEEDLIAGKVYQVLADRSAHALGCLRIVDESGEDYLYPASRFLPFRVSPDQQPRLLKVVKRRPA